MVRVRLVQLLCGILLFASPAYAVTLKDTQITIGTTFNSNGPTCKTTSVLSVKPWEVALGVEGSMWGPGLTVTPIAASGATAMMICFDHGYARPNEVDYYDIRVVDADGVATLTVRISCSSQSGCGFKLQPTPAGATRTPTPIRTPTAQPSTAPSSALPTFAPHPTAVRTVGPIPTPVVIPAGYYAPDIQFKHVSISPRILSAFLRWCPLPNEAGWVSGDQVCADAMENTRTVAGFHMMRLWRHIGNERKVTRWLSESSGFTHVIAHLWTGYRTNFSSGRNDWGTDDDGKLYRVTLNAAKECQKDILSTPAKQQACASFPEPILPQLLDFLDLRIENGKCVKGATFILPPYPTSGTYDKYALTRGLIDYETTLVPWTTEQRGCILDTHLAHHAVTNWHCGVGPRPPDGIVATEHRRCSALAASTQQLRLLTMLPFSGIFDAEWSQVEKCAIARAQDAAHHRWTDAMLAIDGVTKGQWLAIELANIDHAALHLVANLKHPAFGITLAEGKIMDLRSLPVEYEPALLQRLMQQFSAGLIIAPEFVRTSGHG